MIFFMERTWVFIVGASALISQYLPGTNPLLIAFSILMEDMGLSCKLRQDLEVDPEVLE